MNIKEEYGSVVIWKQLKEKNKGMSNQELTSMLVAQGYEKKRVMRSGKKVTVWKTDQIEEANGSAINWKKFPLSNSRERMISRGIIDKSDFILDELRFEFLKIPYAGFSINPGSCGLSYAGYPVNRCAVAWYMKDEDPSFLSEFIELYLSGENPTPAETNASWIKIDKEENYDRISELQWIQNPLHPEWKQTIEVILLGQTVQ